MDKPERNSNIEALRIISMLLIVAFHATGVGYNSKDVGFIVFAWAQVLGSWGILGVDIFLIIAAWFLCDQNFSTKKIIGIVFQTFTWVLFYSVLSFAYDLWKTQSVTETVVQFCTGVYMEIMHPLWSKTYWFVTSYLFMMLSSPLINKVLKSVSQEKLKKVLLILGFIPVYSQFNSSVVGDVVYFAYVYLMIGYFKQYGCAFLEKVAKPRYIMMVTGIIIISRIICYIPENSVMISFIESLLNHTLAANGRHSMIVLFDALLIFFWTIKLEPHQNKTINKVAGCTLGVYMFHENQILSFPNVVEYSFAKLTKIGFIGTSRLFPVQYIAATILVFAVGTIIEYMRQIIIQRPFMKLMIGEYSPAFEKVDAWFYDI